MIHVGFLLHSHRLLRLQSVTHFQKMLMQTALGNWSLVLIAAGAVGNAIDRVARGFVVDMFDFRLIHFPVFNVADIFICVGGVLFVIYFMFQHKDKPNDKNRSGERQ